MIDHEQAHTRAAPMASGPTGPLVGVRIIDLTHALAGPYCTMLLADLGADVVKVESPEGDLSRYTGPNTLDDTENAYGGYFASINRNKRGIVLDLKDAGGQERLRRLVDGADAVIENFRAGVMDRFGLGYEALQARNPRLVYGAIRGYGDPRTGASPYVDWPAFDVIAQAMSGVVSVTGPPGDPMRTGPSIGDLYPATLAALGITAALLNARETGRGQFVDVGMYDALVALCEALVYRFSYTGRVSEPTGNSHPALTPFDVYPTADGACAIAAPTDSHWPVLCDLIGRPELARDERTRTNRDRVRNGDFVREVMLAWTTARTTAEVVGHLAARRMLVAVEHPGSGRPLVFPAPAIHYTGTPAGVYRRAPRLGEHTDEVLSELDLEVT